MAALETDQHKFERILSGLDSKTPPSEISLARCSLTDGHLEKLAATRHWTSITVCILEGNQNITSASMKLLADLVRRSKTLRVLVLGFTGITHKGLNHLTEAVASSPSLHTLSLRNTNLGDHGAEALAKCLHGDIALRNVNLFKCAIGDSGVAKLCTTIIEQQAPISSLDLGNNRFGTEGLSSIGQLVRFSQLATLHLRQSDIRSPDVSMIVEWLPENFHLRVLDLRQNRIGPEGVEAIAESLRDNFTLETLDLQRNQLTNKCVDALVGLVRHNHTLNQVNIKHNGKITDEGIAHITMLAHLLDKNKLIVKLRIELEAAESCLLEHGIELVPEDGASSFTHVHVNGYDPFTASLELSQSSEGASDGTTSPPPSPVGFRSLFAPITGTQSAQARRATRRKPVEGDAGASVGDNAQFVASSPLLWTGLAVLAAAAAGAMVQFKFSVIKA